MGDLIGSLPLAVLASLLAAVVATVGLIVVSINDEWATRNRVHFAAFAAGILVTTSLLLLPAAFRMNEYAPFVALAGYLFLYGINALFRQGSGGMVIAPLLAIGIHSFLDGFEYGILFDHDVFMGWIASIGLITHEFAEAVILYAVLRSGGVNAVAAWIGGFVGAAVTTPLGAVVSQYVLAGMPEADFSLFLAAAAGALLYVGATHLPTHAIDGMRSRVLISYLFGVALALALSLGHDHDHDHDGHDDHELAED
ncbi:MAG: hypothetical protein AAGA69_02300, partial [Pseudomonadota bacterium]